MSARAGRQGGAAALRFRAFIIAWAAVTLFWSLAFMAAERRSLADALYFGVVTVTTVGYGDVVAATPLGRVIAALLILTGAATYMGLVASGTELVLNRRERSARTAKVNMVIGAFFSEAGTTLLVRLAALDRRLGEVRADLVVTRDWDAAEFERVAARLRGHESALEGVAGELGWLKGLLGAKRSFLLRLLENPTLVEHELFTDLLLAVFHLAEELSHRTDLGALPGPDLDHLRVDTERVYGLLIHQWLDHLRYLQGNYPYLYSLALRTNPFDEHASPVVAA